MPSNGELNHKTMNIPPNSRINWKALLRSICIPNNTKFNHSIPMSLKTDLNTSVQVQNSFPFLCKLLYWSWLLECWVLWRCILGTFSSQNSNTLFLGNFIQTAGSAYSQISILSLLTKTTFSAQVSESQTRISNCLLHTVTWTQTQHVQDWIHPFLLNLSPPLFCTRNKI